VLRGGRAADAEHSRRVAAHDGAGLHLLDAHRPGGDHCLLADVRADDRAVADPDVSPHAHARVGAALEADRYVEPLEVVLPAPAEDRHVRPEEHVVAECHVSEVAIDADVHPTPDLGLRRREHRPEPHGHVVRAAAQGQAIEGAAQVVAEHARQEAHELAVALEDSVRARRKEPGADAPERVDGQHENDAQAVRQLLPERARAAVPRRAGGYRRRRCDHAIFSHSSRASRL
jgi:hypothetical protein